MPDIKFDAPTYNELCKIKRTRNSYCYKSKNGSLIPVTEPPLTIGLSDEDLNSFILTPLNTPYPCHTQPVERFVKLTSKSTGKITGRIRQIGEAICTRAARIKSPGRVTRKRQKTDN